EYPSWLYPITQGATTMWERWDGLKPDGTFEDVGMNSFNHYAYGAIGDWMYRTVAGLDGDPAAPGYKHILIHPHPGGGLTSASATLTTPYGAAGSAWRFVGDSFELAARVPANARATVRLPFAQLAEVTEGGRPVAGAPGVTRAVQDGAAVLVEVGSGHYAFAYPAPRLAAIVRGSAVR
ncbi:MAG TPA: alpha-L-rhamnosidase C-terminal domain-containing protein, partial [Gemmatirosa sp.]